MNAVPELLPSVTLETGGNADAAVIWLHGLGADGHDFEPVVPHLGLPSNAAIRFIFPHAPYRPVTINGGMRMRAWYDIAGPEMAQREDKAGIEESAQAIRRLLEHESAAGIDPSRIVLAGFSQGGAMALHCGLRYPERLAGVAALSGYLLLADRLAQEAHPVNCTTPVLMAHGNADTIIPLAAARRSEQHLSALGYRVDWREYPMAHSVCPEEIGAIAAWLRGVLALDG